MIALISASRDLFEQAVRNRRILDPDMARMIFYARPMPHGGFFGLAAGCGSASL